MTKYLNYCKGCKLDCSEGLLPLNNPPHKEFSFDDEFVLDYFCAEHQAIVHEKLGRD